MSMKFLNKTATHTQSSVGLSYGQVSDRDDIKAILLAEQKGFCAYSERFIKQTDSTHIEHFDGRIKDTLQDSYDNWYAVLAWMNLHKPKKIVPYLPMLSPSSLLETRINYDRGFYKTINQGDVEAQNLINYLGFNKAELVVDRKKHVARVKRLRNLCQGDEELFLEELQIDKYNLSFITALEAELNISLFHLLQ